MDTSIWNVCFNGINQTYFHKTLIELSTLKSKYFESIRNTICDEVFKIRPDIMRKETFKNELSLAIEEVFKNENLDLNENTIETMISNNLQEYLEKKEKISLSINLLLAILNNDQFFLETTVLHYIKDVNYNLILSILKNYQ